MLRNWDTGDVYGIADQLKTKSGAIMYRLQPEIGQDVVKVIGLPEGGRVVGVRNVGEEGRSEWENEGVEPWIWRAVTGT
jgi:hypothetical protein